MFYSNSGCLFLLIADLCSLKHISSRWSVGRVLVKCWTPEAGWKTKLSSNWLEGEKLKNQEFILYFIFVLFFATSHYLQCSFYYINMFYLAKFHIFLLIDFAEFCLTKDLLSSAWPPESQNNSKKYL